MQSFLDPEGLMFVISKGLFCYFKVRTNFMIGSTYIKGAGAVVAV
jgi:hypothetical protein